MLWAIIKKLFIIQPIHRSHNILVTTVGIIAAIIILPIASIAQCSITNATSCQCKNGSSNCDLLPNIQIGHPPFSITGTWGVIEFSQTGNGVDNGRLKVTVSTPNSGYGPLELRTTNIFVCGTDTFTGNPPVICPNGIDYPKVLVNQRIYHKNGNVMTYWDRAAGTMTYHPSHGHMHVDDWGIYTLREQTLDPNPLNWPVVGTGSKLAFCVMDYGTCPGYPNHCLDPLGNSLNLASNFPNYGLGGASYNCSPVTQGISSGFVDIYWTSLEGMWINVPATACNGNYWIVTQIDPNNDFLEENENDNVFASPITLTQQIPAGGYANVTSSGAQIVCSVNPVTLKANQNISNLINPAYLWSNGATTQTIQVTAAGVYTVEVTAQCGSTVSSPVTISATTINAPSTTNDTVCVSGSATLTAVGTGTINWYDAATGGTLLYTGNTFNTPVITTTTNYYADNTEAIIGAASYNTPHNNSFGGGANHTVNSRYLIFNALSDFVLVSVKVYAQTSGIRTIELRDSNDVVLQSVTVNIPVGESRVALNFNVTAGTDYHLGISGTLVDLYRNSAGVSFPYSISGVVDITNSSAGTAFYYFYYDWEVKEPDFSCVSLRNTATAFVDACLGINENNPDFMISMYPNPNNGQFIISFTNAVSMSVKVEVIDVYGKVIYRSLQKNAAGNYENKIDLKNAATGIYLVKITYGKQEVQFKMCIR